MSQPNKSILGSVLGLFDTPLKKASAIALIGGSVVAIRRMNANTKKLIDGVKTASKKGGKGNIDKEFRSRIVELMKVVVPSWHCDEAKILVILTVLLVSRTYLSIWLAKVNGRVVKTIVGRDFNMFLKRIAELLVFAVPASSINSGLDFFNKKLGLMFRKRLSKHFFESYLKNMHYYKICNLDSRIANPDQRLTADTEKWGQSLANLYLNITKPVLDVFLFSRNLASLVGWQGPSMIFTWYFFSGLVIQAISPPFGRLTAVE
jgi:ATP-binding cassette subfamily D (ALD) protein 3